MIFKDELLTIYLCHDDEDCCIIFIYKDCKNDFYLEHTLNVCDGINVVDFVKDFNWATQHIKNKVENTINKEIRERILNDLVRERLEKESPLISGRE